MSQLLVDGVECCYTASEHNCLVHSSMLLLWQPSTYQQKWSHQCFFLWSVFLSQSHIFAIIFIYIWKLCWPGKWLYFISELIFSGRLCPVNWRIVIQEDEILWWKVFGQKFFSNISWYPLVLRFPSTNAKVPTPLYDIHPRTITPNFFLRSLFMHSSFHSSLAFL